MSFPFGVLFRDRAAYLDVTLRSLSGTDGAENLAVHVFDDHSSRIEARAYLRSSRILTLRQPLVWPAKSRIWHDHGLSFLPDVKVVRGIGGKVEVHSATESLGVFGASLWALRVLFQTHEHAEFVCLCQDDVVFTVDWFRRLGDVIDDETFRNRPSLITGCIISNSTLPRTVPTEDWWHMSSAQLLVFPRQLWTELGFFHEGHTRRNEFDYSLCRAIGEAGHRIRVMRPACVQHVGIDSRVAPLGEPFLVGHGRLCQYVRGPFAWADEVSDFSTS